MTKTYLKDLIYQVNGCAIEVHKHLGPGLLESVYHTCLKKELTIRGFEFQTELTIPVYYKGLELETGLRCDLLVEKSLVVELKAIEKVLPIHEAQILTYMNLLEIPIGLMINFNVTHIFKEGQKTYVNERYRYLEE
ncbi:GxxExxY protein [Flavobacterium sp. GSP27]|uniref:GxxExxY protein n=1 Tax=Flavobacterium bomense TaxID=2497483 RepID=A0A432CQP8_9FLAO|nr:MULTISPECIES: GxxExxY protein [Flavobacterium]RTY96300.1 GxxExxY protein [Flavobacterium sp. GSN2]RTY70310.1 GxxExxY protein [Flavobacterium sp. LB2P53]RTY76400.1 GxxExxY protein [Flavobacterium sp. LS1R10]RTY88228.1 GxxExxY protein [Flavobacterium sp. RSP15]RTY92697.1 GxxExxY protein [Flavobacterium sp. RSP46]